MAWSEDSLSSICTLGRKKPSCGPGNQSGETEFTSLHLSNGTDGCWLVWSPADWDEHLHYPHKHTMRECGYLIGLWHAVEHHRADSEWMQVWRWLGVDQRRDRGALIKRDRKQAAEMTKKECIQASRRVKRKLSPCRQLQGCKLWCKAMKKVTFFL